MDFVKTKTEDGIEFTGLLSRSNQNNENIIIHIHGMSGDIYVNSFYPFMHNYYPQNGWAFLAGEHRGTHSVSQFIKNDQIVNIGNTYEIFEESVLDIKAWINKAKELGYKNIWLQAHSMGPSKVTYFLNTQEHKDIAGLIFLSPSDMVGLQYVDNTIELHKRLLAEAQQLVLEGKNTQILSEDLDGYKLSALTYVNLFSDKSNEAIFNFKKPELGFSLVNNIDLPLIAFTGTKDDGIAPLKDPYEAMQILEKELIKSPRKKTIVFNGADHDFLGFGQQIVEEAIKFIENS